MVYIQDKVTFIMASLIVLIFHHLFFFVCVCVCVCVGGCSVVVRAMYAISASCGAVTPGWLYC